MNRTQKILILLTVLLALTALLAVILTVYQTSQPFRPRGFRVIPADWELYYLARTIFSTINIVLTLLLIVNFISIYLKTKSEFTAGLLLFISFLLIKDIAWSPFVIGFAGFFLSGLGPFAFLPDMFEMAALLILLYLSIKY